MCQNTVSVNTIDHYVRSTSLQINVLAVLGFQISALPIDVPSGWRWGPAQQAKILQTEAFYFIISILAIVFYRKET